MKIKSYLKKTAARIGVGLSLLVGVSTFAGGPTTTLVPFGTTNTIAAVSTNDVSGNATATVWGLPAFNSSFFYTFGCTSAGTNGTTITLLLDETIANGTNTVFTNGYWINGVVTNTLTANGTNPVVVAGLIANNATGGGAVQYRWRVANTNATVALTNLFFSIYPRGN